MGVYGLQRMGSFACLLFYLGVATSCTVLGGMGSRPNTAVHVSTSKALDPLFQEAEQAYQQRDYARAQQLYESFLGTSPQPPLAEDALFRLGEVLYYEGTFPAAQLRLQDF